MAPGSPSIHGFVKATTRCRVNNGAVDGIDGEAHYGRRRKPRTGARPCRASIETLLNAVGHPHVHDRLIGWIDREAFSAAARGRPDPGPRSARVHAAVEGRTINKKQCAGTG